MDLGTYEPKVSPYGGYHNFIGFFNKELKPFAMSVLKKDKGHIPIVIAVSKDKTRCLSLNTLLSEIEELDDTSKRNKGKNLMAGLMDTFISSHDAFAYVFISECWYANAPKDEPYDDEVRNRTDKEEALAFTWEYKHNGTKKTGSTIVPYYRHDDSIIFMKEVSSITDGSAKGGRFTGFLV